MPGDGVEADVAPDESGNHAPSKTGEKPDVGSTSVGVAGARSSTSRDGADTSRDGAGGAGRAGRATMCSGTKPDAKPCTGGQEPEAGPCTGNRSTSSELGESASIEHPV
jgi:hypothetical protein